MSAQKRALQMLKITGFSRLPGALVLAEVTPSGTIATSAAASAWWQDNLRLALGRATVSDAPAEQASRVYLVRRRGQLSTACDSSVELIITLAEPLYPCRSGRPITYLAPADTRRNRESWLIRLPDPVTGAMPPPLSNLSHQRRPWRTEISTGG